MFKMTASGYNALLKWAYGVVVSMFDFHRSDRGSNRFELFQ